MSWNAELDRKSSILSRGRCRRKVLTPLPAQLSPNFRVRLLCRAQRMLQQLIRKNTRAAIATARERLGM